MFMYQKNESQKERLEKLYKKIKLFYGAVPPQMEFLGNIEADYLEDFITAILRIAKHPRIDPNWFGFVRLHIAFKEDYAYCKAFNTKYLLTKEYTQNQLDATIKDIDAMPFDDKHKALAQYALKVIYESKSCTQNDLDALYTMGWTQKDVFDGVEHACTLFRNGRILTAYSEKEA
ncbi:MAG: hypothetical protein L3J43_01980 [Sulfurovum sp.]|nr:hypothetical protein [Sulfurovum sp.]